jgi:acyl carrier protein
VAFLTGAPETLSEPTALREHLRSRLPAYMVPSSLVPLERLPLTPTGKVDRKALESMDSGATVPRADHVAPRTPTEETMASIWAATLEASSLGVHDNFFEAGGHSLGAARIVTRLRSAFGVDVGMRSLFERPTVAGLSELVDMLLLAGGSPGAQTGADREEMEF